MEAITIILDDGTGREFDLRLKGADGVTTLRDGGDLLIVTKHGAMQSGRAGAMLTFTVEVDGKLVRAQTVVTMRSLLSALRTLQVRYTDNGMPLEVPVVEALDAKILQVVESGAGKLNMRTWHACATTHCRAGWAITLAGEAGAKLEERYGPQRAGTMIYCASTGRVPHFFASDERALQDIREQAALQASAAP